MAAAKSAIITSADPPTANADGKTPPRLTVRKITPSGKPTEPARNATAIQKRMGSLNLTLSAKGLVFVSIPLVSQLLFLGVLAQLQRTNAAAQERYSRAKEIRTQAHTVLQILKVFRGDTSSTSHEGGAFVTHGEMVFRDL